MDMDGNFTPVATATGEAACAELVATLAAAGLAAAPEALARLETLGLPADDAGAEPVVIEIVAQLLDAFDADPRSPVCDIVFGRFAPAQAMHAAELLMRASLPEGGTDLAEIADSNLLCLAGLLAAAGHGADALGLIERTLVGRETPRFAAAAHHARCRILGVDDDIASLWIDEPGFAGTLAEARARIAAQPLDIAAQRACVRLLAAEERWGEAVDTLMVALALPLGAADKAGLGRDLAVLAAWLPGQGHGGLIGSRHARFALAACPEIAREAEAALAGVDRAAGGWRAIAADVLDDVTAFLRGFHAAPVPAYPLRDGKPHADIVWLEITNYCNQKCGFCPDMHREDSRQWLPLDRIKALIDELAETVSVGSMQLNAYGEPLLHPNIAEILSYIREKRLPWPTFFTTHGMTLVDKKLAQLSHNYPAGIAVSLHNDSQESYAATRSAKIGDYETLVARVSALLAQMAREGAPAHMRLYQMVCNGAEDPMVDPVVRGAFPDSPQRMARHVRKWEAIAAGIAATMPPESHCQALTSSYAEIEASFRGASHGDQGHLPVLRWLDVDGNMQLAFISPRPVGTYGNLLLEYDSRWEVKKQLVNRSRCSFVQAPSLAIFATGKLGICCIDMNSTAVFGSLDEFGTISEALHSDPARRIFAQLANGVATSRGCQTCLASGQQLCGPTY